MLQTEIMNLRHKELEARPDADKEALRAIQESVQEWWQTQDLIKVLRINPYTISRQSGVPVQRLVPELLHGVHQGVFNLHWDAHCPHCNAITQEVSHLSEADGLGQCSMCDIEFDVDFVSRVEAAFSYNSEILDMNLPPVCEIPDSLQATYLIKGIMPGQTLEATTRIQSGEYKYFCPITLSKGILDICGAESSTEQVLVIHQLDHSFEETRLQAMPGSIRFIMHNQASSMAGLILHRNVLGPELKEADTTPRMSGLELIHYPLFQKLFGDQAPSERERLKISAVTTLFTDITGSTGLYTTLGDTKAYNIVRDHFNILFEEIEKQGGVVIKTIGDSVMASFRSNQDALRAIVPMQYRLAEYNTNLTEGAQVQIRAGIHRGPAILVNLNGKLDYFGTAINKAARVESISDPGQITISAEVFEDKTTGPLLRKFNITEVRRRSIHLKGLPGDQSVYSFNVPLESEISKVAATNNAA